MAIRGDLISNGMATFLAAKLGTHASTTIATAGTTAATATDLGDVTAAFIASTASNAGVITNGSAGSANVYVYNGDSSNSMDIYPATNDKINQGTAGAAKTLAHGKACALIGSDQGWIMLTSA